MKHILKCLMVTTTIFLFLSSPVYGGWKEIVTQNQTKATNYINQLKDGANPNSLTRPNLRRKNHFKAKRSYREINKAMDEAEALAKAGKADLIKEPEFVYKGASEEKVKK